MSKFACRALAALLLPVSFCAKAVDSVPVQPLASAASAKAIERPFVASVRLDTIGLGAQLLYAVRPDVVVGGYFASGTEDGWLVSNDDPLDENEFGVQARWLWSKQAPRGGYVIAEAAVIHSSFAKSAQETGRTSSSIDDGFRPGIGAGYQAIWGRFALDAGFIFRSSIGYEAHHSNGSSSGTRTSSRTNNLYLSLGYAF